MSEEAIESSGDALAAFVDGPDEKPETDDRPEPKREAKEKPEPKREEPDEEKPEKAEGEKKPEPKKEEKPPEKRRHKVKVQGAESEVDEDELIRGYQRAADVTKKAQEIAAQRKQIEEARALAKTNPAKALEILGLKAEEYREHALKTAREAYLAEYSDKGEPLTPEQKELARLRADAQAREAEKRAVEDKQRAEEETQARTQQERHWVKTIVTALEAKSLPKALLARVAGHLGDAIERDQSLDPADLIEDAIALSLEDAEQEHAAIFDEMSWEQLKTRHPKLVEKVRKGYVADFKARGKPKVEEPVEQEEKTEPRRERKVIRTSRDALRSFLG